MKTKLAQDRSSRFGGFIDKVYPEQALFLAPEALKIFG
jgi:hypothetical protein